METAISGLGARLLGCMDDYKDMRSRAATPSPVHGMGQPPWSCGAAGSPPPPPLCGPVVLVVP